DRLLRNRGRAPGKAKHPIEKARRRSSLDRDLFVHDLSSPPRNVKLARDSSIWLPLTSCPPCAGHPRLTGRIRGSHRGSPHHLMRLSGLHIDEALRHLVGGRDENPGPGRASERREHETLRKTRIPAR